MGKIYSGSSGYRQVGRVERDGKVYSGSSGYNQVGRVESGNTQAGGAALLLLL
jgi:hypothetical protein